MKVTWTIQTLKILNAIHVLSTIAITADGTSSKTNMNALNVPKEQSSIQSFPTVTEHAAQSCLFHYLYLLENMISSLLHVS